MPTIKVNVVRRVARDMKTDHQNADGSCVLCCAPWPCWGYEFGDSLDRLSEIALILDDHFAKNTTRTLKPKEGRIFALLAGL